MWNRHGFRNRLKCHLIVVNETPVMVKPSCSGITSLERSHRPKNGDPCTPHTGESPTWTPSLRRCCFQEDSQASAVRSVQDTLVSPPSVTKPRDWSVCLLSLKHLVSLQTRTRSSVQTKVHFIRSSSFRILIRVMKPCVCVLLPLKICVDQSSRTYDLKKYLFVCDM
jgi:hypothetical protein